MTARQVDESALSGVAKKATENKSFFVSSLAERNQASRVAESLADLPHLKENASELLINGEATFASIFAGIENATDYVLVQFFIVKDDTLGRRLQNLLIKKAQQGVQVFFYMTKLAAINYLKPTYTSCVKMAYKPITSIRERGRKTGFRSISEIIEKLLSLTVRAVG